MNFKRKQTKKQLFNLIELCHEQCSRSYLWSGVSPKFLDKTATVYRKTYGRLKRPHILANIRTFGQSTFSKHVNRQHRPRYSNPPISAVSADALIDKYEADVVTEQNVLARDTDAVDLQAVKRACSLSKPHGTKTVRDFRKPAFGYAQALLITLERGKTRDRGPGLLEILNSRDAGSQAGETHAANLLNVGSGSRS